MKFELVSLSAIVSPCPAILLRYTDQSNPSKKVSRKRFIPIRDEHFESNSELSHLEKIADALINRHSDFLKPVDRKQLLTVIRVVQKVRKGANVKVAVNETEEEFDDYKSSDSKSSNSNQVSNSKTKKKVSFRETHEEKAISDDEFEIDLPDDSDQKIEITNYTWNDEDDDEFVF